MSFKLSSVVWQLAKIDEDNKELAWCLIKGRDECTRPIRRGGTNARNFSTGIVKRHFEKYHPKELANAEKKIQDEKASKIKHVSTFFETVAAQNQNLESPLSPLSPLANAERKIEDDETVVSDPGGSPPPLSPSNSVSSIASTVLLEEEDLNYSEALKQFIDFTPPQSPLPSLEACYSRPAGLVHNHLAWYEINIHKNCEFCDTPLKQVGTDGSQAQECTCTPCRSISDTDMEITKF